MKGVWKATSIALTLLLVGYFLYYIFVTFEAQDFSALQTPSAMLGIVIASVCYALVIPLSALAWQRLLQGYNENVSVSLLASIMGVTQFAKYVPGNFAQHLGRATLSLAKGIKFQSFLPTVLIESGLVALASLIVGNIFLLQNPDAMTSIFDTERYPIADLLQLSLIALLTLFVAFLLATQRLIRSQRIQWKYFPQHSVAPFVYAISIYSLNLLLIGFGMWQLAKYMGIGANLSYGLITAAFAWSWLAGFLTIGAPAGVGVREAVLAILLTNASTETQVLAFILAMRMATLLGDCWCFILGAYGIAKIKHENHS